MARVSGDLLKTYSWPFGDFCFECEQAARICNGKCRFGMAFGPDEAVSFWVICQHFAVSFWLICQHFVVVGMVNNRSCLM